MKDIKALLLVTVFLLSIFSSMASAMPHEEEQIISEVDDRMPFRGDKFSTEDYGWWFSYGPDINFDGLDDRLERVIAGEESESTTAIIGADGRKTVAIVVDYAWHPGQHEID